MAGLLTEIIFNAGRLKKYDILAYQIMPDHVHVLACIKHTDRTLENVRSIGGGHGSPTPERTLSRVRSGNKNNQYNISDFMPMIMRLRQMRL